MKLILTCLLLVNLLSFNACSQNGNPEQATCMLQGERNIYLGKNIPDYPLTKNTGSIIPKTIEIFTGSVNDNLFIISALVPHWESFCR